MDISIIIVNYNSGSLLCQCLDSIFLNLLEFNYEVIVVDNMSSDTSFASCSKYVNGNLKLIQAGKNLGFSKANNLGARYAQGKFLHFLNPDTRLDSSMIKDYKVLLKDFSQSKSYVYVNPFKDKDGSVYYGRNALPGTLNWLRYYFCRRNTKWYYIGASVIISKRDFERIGKWNEEFFMYSEDADFFCKINMSKIPIVELPSVIYHYGGGSSKNAFTNIQREVIIQKSLRVYRKSNQMSWLDFWIWQALVVFAFWKKPYRMMWQVKAIYLSFKKSDYSKK